MHACLQCICNLYSKECHLIAFVQPILRTKTIEHTELLFTHKTEDKIFIFGG